MIYDDYNSNIRKDQNTIGTLTCNIGSSTPRNSYKLIEIYGAAMRGRYNSDGKTEQKIEVRDDELSNTITTVQKDSLVVETQSWLEKKYTEFDEKHGYIPEYFVPYNGTEVKDYAPVTLDEILEKNK